MALDLKSYPLPVARTVADLRAEVAVWRSQGVKVALIPTMGALHDGHLSLGRMARHHAERVVYSIFVNPKQFGPNEDFDRYPRTEPEDAAKLWKARADLLFAPSPREMYPEGFATAIQVSGVTEDLEGAFRPGFFGGVATVVSKLLLQCLPDFAFFGEKDYQQLLTVRRMVRDLDIPVAIMAGPTLREQDGLAMSSRNAYLTREERAVAGQLNVIMAETVKALEAGKEPAANLADSIARLKRLGFDAVDYFTLRDAETLAPLDHLDRPGRLLAAVRLGGTRLIDNMPVNYS